jgi:hypothetical protein
MDSSVQLPDKVRVAGRDRGQHCATNRHLGRNMGPLQACGACSRSWTNLLGIVLLPCWSLNGQLRLYLSHTVTDPAARVQRA